MAGPVVGSVIGPEFEPVVGPVVGQVVGPVVEPLVAQVVGPVNGPVVELSVAERHVWQQNYQNNESNVSLQHPHPHFLSWFAIFSQINHCKRGSEILPLETQEISIKMYTLYLFAQ